MEEAGYSAGGSDNPRALQEVIDGFARGRRLHVLELRHDLERSHVRGHFNTMFAKLPQILRQRLSRLNLISNF